MAAKSHNWLGQTQREGGPGWFAAYNLEVVGKWYSASLWRRGFQPQSQRGYASMLQQSVLQSRLRDHRVSHSLSLLDVSNAFPSPTRECLQMAVSNVARPQDAVLLQQRHERTYICIPVRDADLCVQPTWNGGFIKGDTVACSLFLELYYHPPLDAWLCEAQQRELLVQDHISSQVVDVSVSS